MSARINSPARARISEANPWRSLGTKRSCQRRRLCSETGTKRVINRRRLRGPPARLSLSLNGAASHGCRTQGQCGPSLLLPAPCSRGALPTSLPHRKLIPSKSASFLMERRRTEFLLRHAPGTVCLPGRWRRRRRRYLITFRDHATRRHGTLLARLSRPPPPPCATVSPLLLVYCFRDEEGGGGDELEIGLRVKMGSKQPIPSSIFWRVQSLR